jgi:hypothetical protein
VQDLSAARRDDLAHASRDSDIVCDAAGPHQNGRFAHDPRLGAPQGRAVTPRTQKVTFTAHPQFAG